jgi:hypothetical protein
MVEISPSLFTLVGKHRSVQSVLAFASSVERKFAFLPHQQKNGKAAF